MEYRIEKVKALELSTTESELELGCSGFLMVNLSKTATVYFKEKSYDGTAVTARSGFALLPGESTGVVLCARTLSLTASEAATDVRLLLCESL